VHVSLTTTTDPANGPLRDATLAGEEMLPWLRGIEGFEGLLMLSNPDDGRTLVLTFWESREIAEHHSHARTRFRESITSAVRVEVEGTTGYEVTFAAVGPLETPAPS